MANAHERPTTAAGGDTLMGGVGSGNHLAPGKPRRWGDENALMTDFKAYIDHCLLKHLLPNVAGFCTFCAVVRDTFYETRNYYPDTYALVRQALEDTTVNFQRFTGYQCQQMALGYARNALGWDGQQIGSQGQSVIDVDFDAADDEIDLLIGKLGYQRLPEPD